MPGNKHAMLKVARDKVKEVGASAHMVLYLLDFAVAWVDNSVDLEYPGGVLGKGMIGSKLLFGKITKGRDQ